MKMATTRGKQAVGRPLLKTFGGWWTAVHAEHHGTVGAPLSRAVEYRCCRAVGDRWFDFFERLGTAVATVERLDTAVSKFEAFANR